MHLPRIVVLTIVLGLAASTACRKTVPPAVPDELVGTWVTDEPVYHDRSLKLEKGYVVIGFGENENPRAQRVTKVDTVRNDSGLICTIYSGDQEGSHHVTVYYDRSDGGFIFFRNVRGKWRRTHQG